jgi:hypothetical protein
MVGRPCLALKIVFVAWLEVTLGGLIDGKLGPRRRLRVSSTVRWNPLGRVNLRMRSIVSFSLRAD